MTNNAEQQFLELVALWQRDRTRVILEALATTLIALGNELADAKHEYMIVLADEREKVRSKADAEIVAMQTETWHAYERKKNLYESGKTFVLFLGKEFDTGNALRDIVKE